MDVGQLADQLNEAIRRVEDAIESACPFRVAVSVDMSETQALWYCAMGSSWGLAVERKGTSDSFSALKHTSLETRVRAVNALDGLLVAIRSERARLEATIQQAIGKAHAFADTLEAR